MTLENTEGWDFDLETEETQETQEKIPEKLKEKPKEIEIEKPKEIEKEICPYCFKKFVSLKRHSCKKKEEIIALNDTDFKICWEALSRVLRQLSGKRSGDWKRGAIPVRDKLEDYLKKKGVIT